jgi:hypothetical protein
MKKIGEGEKEGGEGMAPKYKGREESWRREKKEKWKEVAWQGKRYEEGRRW